MISRDIISRFFFVVKIFSSGVLSLWAYYFFYFSILDAIFFLYLGIIILFRWNWIPIFWNGVGLLFFSFILGSSRSDSQFHPFSLYGQWLVGISLALAMFEKLYYAIHEYKIVFSAITRWLHKLKNYRIDPRFFLSFRMNIIREMKRSFYLVALTILYSSQIFLSFTTKAIKGIGRFLHSVALDIFYSSQKIWVYISRRVAIIFCKFFWNFPVHIRLKILVLITFTIFFLFATNVPLFYAFLFVYFLAQTFFFLDSRIMLISGIMSIFCIPFFFIAGRDTSAGLFAIYSYYFIVIGTIGQIYESWHENEVM